MEQMAQEGERGGMLDMRPILKDVDPLIISGRTVSGYARHARGAEGQVDLITHH